MKYFVLSKRLLFDSSTNKNFIFKEMFRCIFYFIFFKIKKLIILINIKYKKKNNDFKNYLNASKDENEKIKIRFSHRLKNRFLSAIFRLYIGYWTTSKGYWVPIIERFGTNKSVKKSNVKWCAEQQKKPVKILEIY